MIIKKCSERNGIAILVLVVIAAFVLPWKNISWGKFRVQEETIIVSGESRTEKKNEVASFSAGVNVIKEQKQEAIDEVNKKVDEMVAAIKNFGIADGDIKTQSINVYEQQETEGSKKNKWIVNNTVEVTLKDVSKTNDLVNLLNSSGANQIYGPNFRIDDAADTEKGLYDSAMEDAKEKAELIAKASGRKLGKVVNVVDGSSTSPYQVYKSAVYEGMGGPSAEPGSTTISKALTVTFEFK